MKRENDIYELIKLDFAGKLNDEQRQVLNDWKRESEENLKEFTNINEVLEYSDRLRMMYSIDVSNDLKAVKKKFNRGGVVRQLYSNFQKVAAILMLPLLIYTLYTFVGGFGADERAGIMKTTKTAHGIQTQIELADGTKVWLNSASELSYPDKFTGDKRVVKLSGEAYFQVESDKENPFFVDLGGYMVKATGTSFNITNFEDWDEMSTFLEHGVVSLVRVQGEKEIEFGKMKPNQLVVLDKKKQTYRKENVDGEKYLSWMDGKLVFRRDKMKEVARRLGHWYNADVVVEGEELYSYIFNATFEYETLEEALMLLSSSSPIAYTIEKGKKTDQSAMSKRKVIITKTK